MMLKLSNFKHHLKGFSGGMFFGFGLSNQEDKKHVGLLGKFWSCPIFVEEMNSCLWIAALKIHSGRQLQIVIHSLGKISCVGDVKRSKTSHVFIISL